jgi:hypothetical protein
MKTATFVSMIVLTWLNLAAVHGFVVVTNVKAMTTTVLCLHPDQAKELEACAFELTKSYLQHSSGDHRRGRSTTTKGPISAIRRLWGHGPEYEPATTTRRQRERQATKTKALGSKKP